MQIFAIEHLSRISKEFAACFPSFSTGPDLPSDATCSVGVSVGGAG
jgi:hypothetical protein